MPRPGCIVRSSLAVFGVLFFPIALWFAFRRLWLEAFVLGVISILFMRLAFDKSEDSWISAVDDLDGPTK